MNRKISIIIPVYNGEKYLERCINSVLIQSYTNYEIILVDDGSTDKTQKICDEYADKFSSIRVFHTKNYGVSNARNVGINASIGAYIRFIDSDDYLLPDALENEIDNICDTDMVISNYYEQIENQAEKKPISNISRLVSCNQTEAARDFFLSKYGFQGYLWNKLFVSNLIKKNKIMFRKGMKFAEDRLFVMQYLLVCNSVKFINIYTYVYNRNPTSATGKSHDIRIENNDSLEFYKIIESDVKEKCNPAYGAFCYSFLSRCIQAYNLEHSMVNKKLMRQYYYNIMHLKGNNITLALKFKATLKYLFKLTNIRS